MKFSKAARRVVDRMVQPTERDKQIKVGPSALGDMCQRCLAENLVGMQPSEGSQALAPWIGTAVHSYLESLFAADDIVLTETKVKVGQVDGYGVVNGSMDHYNLTENHTIDYKVVSKKKIKQYQHATVTDRGRVVFDNKALGVSTLKKYWVQLSLYSKGMEDLGYPVQNMSLLLIPRDVTIEKIPEAVTEVMFPYDREVAERALLRASEIYKWATTDGNDLTELPSDPGCWYCNTQRWRN